MARERCLFAKVLRRWGKDRWEHRTSLAGVVDNEGAQGRGDGGNPVAMIVVIGNVTSCHRQSTLGRFNHTGSYGPLHTRTGEAPIASAETLLARCTLFGQRVK